MRTDYFKQIYYDMRYQPVISVVSVIGTALAIFFIMVMVMTFRARVVPFAPESNRDRTLYGKHLELRKTDGRGGMSSSFSLEIGQKLYGDLKSAEDVTFYTYPERTEVFLPGEERTEAIAQYIDDAFFRVFDHQFLAGAPLSHESSDAGLKEVTVSRRIARRYFGSADEAVGKEIYISDIPYRITGVVKDSSPLSETAYGDVFISYRADEDSQITWNTYLGNFYCTILARSSSDFESIRAEVAARRQAVNSELKDENLEIVDHGSPYTLEEAIYARASNGESEAGAKRRERYLIYAILLIIPAINLSSMTRSRLRHRIAEIGVRRAYGAQRSDILRSLLAENFIVTLAGAAIGLLLSAICGYFFANSMMTDLVSTEDLSIPLSVLLDWRAFGIMLVFCFILNLLSAGLPALQASGTDPVKALNDKNF